MRASMVLAESRPDIRDCPLSTLRPIEGRGEARIAWKDVMVHGNSHESGSLSSPQPTFFICIQIPMAIYR
jgi:hypothetical protein